MIAVDAHVVRPSLHIDILDGPPPRLGSEPLPPERLVRGQLHGRKIDVGGSQCPNQFILLSGREHPCNDHGINIRSLRVGEDGPQVVVAELGGAIVDLPGLMPP